jgi:hypothetical protein
LQGEIDDPHPATGQEINIALLARLIDDLLTLGKMPPAAGFLEIAPVRRTERGEHLNIRQVMYFGRVHSFILRRHVTVWAR